MGRYLPITLMLLLACQTALGAEVHSNGRGGGRWSDPAAWHGGRVPAAADVVVVAMRDSVTYDGGAGDTPACAAIFLDPEAVLAFQAGDEDQVLVVDGPVESYGTIKLDATASPRGVKELRLRGSAERPAALRLLENAALLVYGHESPRGNGPNARLTGAPAAEGQPAQPLTVSADGRVMVDIHHAALAHAVLDLRNLDNTGARATERLNLVDNAFTGLARVSLRDCDTPALRGNRFAPGEGVTPAGPALFLEGCKLAEIRGNRIEGAYPIGVQVQADVDSSAIDNRVAGCAQGFYWTGQNAMLRGNLIRDCPTGIRFHAATGVLEESRVQGAQLALHLTSSTLQISSCVVEGLTEGGQALKLNQSFASLLNCNIADDVIAVEGNPPANSGWVETMQYLVVRASGASLPAEAQVTVQTAAVSGGVPAGKADLNVRNSPAPLGRDGRTPLPASLRALIVRSWQIGRDGKRINAPFYDLMITLPQPGQPPKVLHQQLIEPAETWSRPDPASPEPALEVTLP